LPRLHIISFRFFPSFRYALYSGTDSCIETPFKAFKDFPNSAPYVGAFVTHTQNTLINHVENIENNMDRIKSSLKGQDATSDVSGDFAFVVYIYGPFQRSPCAIYFMKQMRIFLHL